MAHRQRRQKEAGEEIIFEDATRLATLASELASIKAGESSGDGTHTRR